MSRLGSVPGLSGRFLASGLGLLLLALAPLAPRARAQDPNLLDVRIDSIDPSNFPELVILAQVIDPAGWSLRNLERRHLALYEDDFLLKLLEISLDKDPISVVLALDSSGTMKPAEDQVKETAANMLRTLDPRDAAAVIEFSSEPRFLSRFGESRGRAIQSLNAVVPFGPTALYDGLYRSLLELGARKGRRHVVVITDGRDQNKTGTGPGSRHNESEVIELAKKLDVTIHAVALGPLAMKKELAHLAFRTRGSAFQAPRPHHLRDLYKRIISRLEGRIRLRARTRRPELDSTLRTLSLRVRAGESFGQGTGDYLSPGRWVLDMAPVGWKDGDLEEVAARAVKLKSHELEELEPGDRESLMRFLEALFRKPPR